MDQIKNVSFITIFLKKILDKKIINFFERKIDVVISDMAADTTGNKSLDSIRTNQLCSEVLNLSTKILKPKRSISNKIVYGR